MSKILKNLEIPLLFSTYYSTCSWRVRIALSIKGIKYNVRSINLTRNEQNGSEYLQLNPMGIIPTLIINGNVLTESIAIMEYLEETVKSNPLLPEDSLDRAKVRSICQSISSGIQPLQSLRARKNHSPNREEQQEWVVHWIHVGFSALEKTLSKTSGQFSFGNQVTMADCCLIPQVGNALRFNLPIDRYPNISRIYQNTLHLPEFIEASPSNQPDFIPE